ncbi:MAG: GNAT family N-acetyltransferase [Methylocystis sp.]
MYLRAEFRGRGGAGVLMSAILDHARGRVEIVTLTAMSDNPRAGLLSTLGFRRLWRRARLGEM